MRFIPLYIMKLTYGKSMAGRHNKHCNILSFIPTVPIKVEIIQIHLILILHGMKWWLRRLIQHRRYIVNVLKPITILSLQKLNLRHRGLFGKIFFCNNSVFKY